MKVLRLAILCTITSITASAAAAGSREWSKYKEPEPIVRIAHAGTMPAANRLGSWNAQQAATSAPDSMKGWKVPDTVSGSGLKAHLDTVMNSTSQVEIGKALDSLIKPEYAGSSAAADSQISQALIHKIPEYGKSDAIASLDDASKCNLRKAITVLRVTFGGLRQPALESAITVLTPLLDRGTYDASANIGWSAVDCMGWAMTIAKRYGYTVSKDACDSAVSTLMSLMDKVPSACSIFAMICENRKGDLETLGPLLQKYKALLLSGFAGDPERDAFIRIYCVVPDAVGSTDANRMVERWMCYPWDQPSASPWLGLLAKIRMADSVSAEEAAEKLVQVHGSLQEGDPGGVGLGVTIITWCQRHRDSPRYLELMGLAGMDSRTVSLVEGMHPDSAMTPRNLYAISSLAHVEKGQPVSNVLDTLISQTRINLAKVGQYPLDVITHLYLDRRKTSEKPVMFMVFTTRPYGFPFGEVAFGAFDYGKFDIRVIEPGSDTMTVAMLKETSARLGKRGRYLFESCHGDTTGILLRSTEQRPGREYLDVGDTALFREIVPAMQPGFDIVINACRTGAGDYNLAMVEAQYTRSRSFGADRTNGGLDTVIFGDDLEIREVRYAGAHTKVYDYRATTATGTQPAAAWPEMRMRQAGGTFVISNIWTRNTECTIYDLSGRTLVKLRPDASNRFVWNANGTAAGTYLARIKERERTITLRLGRN